MAITIIQTTLEIKCDTSQEAADLLQALRPSANDRGLVELHAFSTGRMLGAGQSGIMRRAQDDAAYTEYKANGGTVGRLGWSSHGKPTEPGGEVYDQFELELMHK